MNSELWAVIRRLSEVEKLSQRAIARQLGIHRNTVWRALGSTVGPPRRAVGHSRPGQLDPFHFHLNQRLAEYPDLSAQKLFHEIQDQGYAGGYTQVKKYVRKHRGPSAPKAFLRLETLPGEYAQVDWANIGTVVVGNARRKLSCFVMVLSYSRMIYLEFTLSQCLEDFLACHVNAFHFWGGIPRKINYDNLKAVVLSRVGRDIRFQPRFLDFAGCYLFEPIPCNVRAGWEKGKVESGIKYIRSAFLAGRPLPAWPELQRQAVLWRDGEANQRIHGTTREKPLDRFEQEKPLLQPLPTQDYDCAIIRSIPVSSQALFSFQANRYSVPYLFVGKTVTVKASSHHIHIYDGFRLLATHLRSYEQHKIFENPDHFQGLLAQRKRAQATKQHESFLKLAPECASYLDGLVQSELHIQSHLDRIQNLIHLYGKTEVAGAIAHALRFRAFGAHYIQRIITQQRAAKNRSAPEPIVLTKKPDWNKISVEQPNLSLYDELFEDKP